jgi:hypothetical protein
VSARKSKAKARAHHLDRDLARRMLAAAKRTAAVVVELRDIQRALRRHPGFRRPWSGNDYIGETLSSYLDNVIEAILVDGSLLEAPGHDAAARLTDAAHHGARNLERDVRQEWRELKAWAKRDVPGAAARLRRNERRAAREAARKEA